MSEEYKYRSDRFLWKGHFFRATDESCKCGEDFVVLRRTGYESELAKLPTNHGVHPKICVRIEKIREKLY